VSVRDIGGIMFMIAMSGIFGYGIPLDRVPARMTALVTGLTDSTFITMAIIVGILVLFGMFMDGAIVIILVTPILLPLVRAVGVDPVVFGIVTTVVVTMGVLTPPFGIAMYVVNGILGSRLEDYLRESIPFIIVVLITVFIYLAFPGLILAVPRLLYG
jgi:TRAP-type transport system large permease protein